MSETKLSVVLPVYNGMPFLKEAIISLLNQSYQNFIIHLIDNGSNDGTYEYLSQKRICTSYLFSWSSHQNYILLTSPGVIYSTSPC